MKRCNERGASLLEFAIVLPIITLFIFGFIDIARYWQAYSALTYAAQHGLNIAVVIPNLERGVENPNDSLYLAAKNSLINEVKIKANQLVLTSWGNRDTVLTSEPAFNFPVSSTDYQNTPIEIELRAEYNALFVPMAPVEIIAKSSGFREPRRTQAMPIPVDCWGRPLDFTNPPGGGMYAFGCPCGNGDYSFNAFGSCVCSDIFLGENGLSLQADGKCGCPPGKVPVSPSSQDEIDSQQLADFMADIGTLCCEEGTAKVCPSGTTREVGGCNCICPTGAIAAADGTCGCDSPNATFDPQQGCVCKPDLEPCEGDQIRDEDTCQCKCPEGMSTVPGGFGCNSSSTCSCGANKILSEGQCICDPDVVCDPGYTKNGSTCVCECASHMSVVGGVCTCGAGKIESGNQCICDPSIVCDAPKVKNASCQCACPAGQTESNGFCCPSGQIYNVTAQACECGAGKVMSGSTCVCENTTPPANTPAGAVQNSSCNWACPTGTANKSNVCCPTDSQNVNGVCVCDSASKQLSGDGRSCVCRGDLEACPADMKRNTSTCECDCPANSTKSANGQSCSCTAPGKVVIGGTCQCAPCSNGMSLNYSTCACSCVGGNKHVINSGGKDFCSYVYCHSACTFSSDGSCSCPMEGGAN